MPLVQRRSLGILSQQVHQTISSRPTPPTPSSCFFSLCCPLQALSKDPEKRREQLAKQLEYSNKIFRESEAFRISARERYERREKKMRAEDPAYDRARNEYKSAHFHAMYQNEEYRQLCLFRHWVIKAGLRNGLIWRDYSPVLYDDKVKHVCVGCEYPTRNGLKFWWRQISDPNIYKCHQCYCAPGVSKVMPVGYEDVKFGSGKPIKPRSFAAAPALSSFVQVGSHTDTEKKQGKQEKESCPGSQDESKS